MSPITAPPRGRNAFADPATGQLDLWTVNHNEEQGGSRIRSITNMQPTIARWEAVRAIRQQGDADSLVYKLAGFLDAQQHAIFLRYLDLSQRQTIYFFHFSGEGWECQLSDYEPQRKWVVRGPRGSDNYWVYAVQLDMLAPLTG